MPSYLEREQNTPVSPAMANPNAILGTFGAKQQYWAIGAAQAKNAYQSYLNLDLSNAGNQEQLGKLMSGSKQRLTQFAQTDLSVGDNINAALKTFDPINKDRDIMGDHGLTTSIKNQIATGDSYRLKDGGKEYNEASVRSLQSLLQLYATDPNKSSWQNYASIQDKYTPYYDKVGEIDKLQKMFKTDVIETSKTTGTGYIQDRKDSSWVRSKWQAFLEANASPQLRNQLKIESNADYRQNLLLSRNDPARVYNHYAQKFDNMRREQYDDSLQAYNRATTELRGLSKNNPNYDQLRQKYEETITQAGRTINSLNDKNNPQNFLPKELVDTNNIGYGQEVAASLYQHEYFGNIGKSFAHADVSEKVRQDGAYFANLNVQARYAEMRQDQSQFNSQMQFKEKELNQADRLATAKLEADYAIAGMKYDAKTGKATPYDELPFRTNEAQNAGKTGEELGAEIMEGFNNAMSNGHSNLYDAAAGEYIGSNAYIDALNAGGDTPLNRITLPGGGGSEQKDRLATFLSEALLGSPAYKELGINRSRIEDEKLAFKTKLDLLPAAKVKELLNRALSNENLMGSVLSKVTDKDGGFQFKARAEEANKALQNSIDAYNQKYGPAVVDVLKQAGLQSYYGEDTPEYKAGLRGYEQEINKFTLPTDKQLEALVASKHIVSFAGSLSSNPAKSAQEAREKMVNDLKKKIYGAVGKQGEAIATGMASTFTITNKNKPRANSFLTSVTNTLTGDNDPDAVALAGIVARNMDAIQTYTTYGTTLDGKARIGVVLDKKKLDPEDQKALPANYDKVRLISNSELIDPQFKNNDPTFLAIANKGKKFNIDYSIPGTVGGGEGEVHVYNSESFSNPKFNIEASYYMPDVTSDGMFRYDADHNLMLKRVSPHDVNDMLDKNLMKKRGEGLQQTLAKDPGVVYQTMLRQMQKVKEYSNQIRMMGPKKVSDLPKTLVDQLEKITQ